MTSPSTSVPTLEVAERSDPGRDPAKQVNEDSCGHRATRFGHLVVVCDGMGGHFGGKEASTRAVAAIFEGFERAPSYAKPRDVLRRAIEVANEQVWEIGTSDASAGHPGSTVVAILVHAGGVEVAHVGDSRCYRMSGGKVAQVTKDHSLVQGLIDAGMVKPEEAKTHPSAHRITRALGTQESAEVEQSATPLPLAPGDVYLLCSDGLSDLVEPSDLEPILAGDPAAAAEKLVALANERGGHDNITAVVARVAPAGGPARKATRELELDLGGVMVPSQRRAPEPAEAAKPAPAPPRPAGPPRPAPVAKVALTAKPVPATPPAAAAAPAAAPKRSLSGELDFSSAIPESTPKPAVDAAKAAPTPAAPAPQRTTSGDFEFDFSAPGSSPKPQTSTAVAATKAPGEIDLDLVPPQKAAPPRKLSGELDLDLASVPPQKLAAPPRRLSGELDLDLEAAAAAQPASVKPAPAAAPVSVKPAPAAPVSVKPAPAAPVSVKPAPAAPVSVKPAAATAPAAALSLDEPADLAGAELDLLPPISHAPRSPKPEASPPLPGVVAVPAAPSSSPSVSKPAPPAPPSPPPSAPPVLSPRVKAPSLPEPFMAPPEPFMPPPASQPRPAASTPPVSQRPAPAIQAKEASLPPARREAEPASWRETPPISTRPRPTSGAPKAGVDRKRKVVVGLAGGVAVIATLAVVAGLRARASKADGLLAPAIAPYAEAGFVRASAGLLSSAQKVEADIPDATCVLAVPSPGAGVVHLEWPNGSGQGKGPLLHCACNAEHVEARVDPVAGAVSAVALLHVDGRAIGGRYAFFEPRPTVLAGGTECQAEALEAYVATTHPKSPADPKWVESAAGKALSSRGFTALAHVPKDHPMALLEPATSQCFVASGGGAKVALRVNANVVAEGMNVGWCAAKVGVVIVEHAGGGDVDVAVAPTRRIGGMLGLRDSMLAAALDGPTWAPAADHAELAAEALRASVVPDVTLAPTGSILKGDAPTARVVSLSVGGDRSFEVDPSSDAFFLCAPPLGATAPQSLCVQNAAQTWHPPPATVPAGAAWGSLPVWMAAWAKTSDPDVVKLEVQLLGLARRLAALGFEPTVIEGVKEEPDGVSIVARSGEDSIVAVGLWPAPPWVAPYGEPAWSLDGEPRIVSLKGMERAHFAAHAFTSAPLGARRTVVFRRASK